MKKILLFVLFFSASQIYSQTYNITAGGTYNVCTGTFVDSGGAGGNYSNGESGDVITFCPSTPGDLIRIDFSVFDVEDGAFFVYDFLEVWNANSNAGAADDQFFGNLGAFSIVSTSPDGCLTFEFTSDGSVTEPGWVGAISCVTPCIAPTAAMDTTTVDICNPNALNPGSLTVNFDASSSTAGAGFSIASYQWNFGDGTITTTATATTSHTYASAPGVYEVTLIVRDNNTGVNPLGCVSTNNVSKLIRVFPEPDFSGTPTTYNITCGDSVTLTGVVSSQTETQDLPAVTSGVINLPDGSGTSYTSTLDFSGYFNAGAMMTAGCYPTMSFDLEHSWVGDLIITLTAPSGEIVTVFDGNLTNDVTDLFGTCVNAATDGVPGCTEVYTIVESGGVNWTDAGVTTTATTNCGIYAGACEAGDYFIGQTYNTMNSFAALNGADLNGVWTITITDDQGSDDGIINFWSLDFPPACYGSLETVTPDLSTATWTGSTGPSLPAQTTTSVIVNNPGPDTCPTTATCQGTILTNSPMVGPFPTVGNFTYTLTTVDEFGCEFDQDVVVNVTCSCILTLDTAGTETQSVCVNENITNITYTVGADATGATVSGLPAGVTGTYAAGVFTISGAPTTNVGSPFNYTVTTVGCVPNLSLTGTITVNPTPAIPTTTTVAATCLADGSTTITNYDGTLTYTFSPAGPTAGAGGTITGATLGTAYTITSTNGGCTSLSSAAFTNMAMFTTPAVPTITTVAETCLADGSTTITNYDGTLTYTFSPAGPTAGAGGTITGATLGTAYTITAGNANCTSAASAAFTNVAMFTTPAVPTTTTVAATCLADGSTTITNYDGTLTYTFSPAGPTAGAGGTITGATLGTAYTITAGNANCTSAASAAFTNVAMFMTPAVPTTTTVAATCLADGSTTITNYDGTLTYTFSPAGPTAGAGGTITGATLGTAYTITAGNANCTSAASAAFTNVAQLAAQPIPTLNSVAATCLADGSTTITNYNASNTYTFSPAGPTAGAGGTITGATLGTAYTITSTNGGCTSLSSAAFTNMAMFTTPVVPTITTVAETCLADGSTTITNYDGTLTYTFSPAGPTAGAGGTITGATLGTAYTITAGNANCTSAASAAFTNVAMLMTPAVPTTTTVAATCLADGSTTITNYDGTLTYTFSPAGPTAGAGGTITGATLGTAYTITAGNANCTSAASAAFTNVAMLMTPAVPTTTTVAATCLADGSTTITNYDGTLTYTFSPAGPTAGAGGTITGATLGTAYTITAGNANCTSAASAAFTNVAMFTTPAIPTTTTVAATCLADGSTTITNYDGTLTYTFSPAGPTAGAGGTITGATLGTAYTITAGNANCTSAASAAFTNVAMLMTPAVPTTTTVAATCLADGSTTITNYDGTLTYTFSPAGPTAGAGGTITGATLGTAYTITAGNANCTSAASAAFTNVAMFMTPAVPTTTTVAATCLADGSTTITNYDGTLTYTFSPAGPTAGAGGTITGATLGTAYTITAGNANCTSAASAAFTNVAQLAAQPVPTLNSVAATCLADGSTTITNYNASNTYTFSPAGPTAGAGGTITGATLGTAYTITSTNGGCTSLSSAAFTNMAMLMTPAVPTTTTVAETCLADGSTTITNYDGTLTYTFSPAGPTAGAGGTITGATLGTAYTITAGNANCTSAASAAFTNVAMFMTPAVPTITTVAATCLADGSTTITNYDGTLTYTFSPAGPTAGAGGTITGATLGTAYTITAGNANCTSAASAAFTNVAMFTTPAVPTTTTVAATCLADGSTTITNYDGTLTYTFSPAGPTAGAGGTITGATLGTAYTITAGNANCTSAASAAFTNVAMLMTPAVPTTTTVAATCLADGSTTITNYDGTLTYTFSPAGPTAGAGGTITGATLGTAYTITAGNANCTSAASAAFTNVAMFMTPAVPTITTVAATCLADGSTTITNYDGTLTYTFSPAGPTAGAGGTITGATLGTAYTITAGNGSCSSAVSAAFSNGVQFNAASISGNLLICVGNSTDLLGSDEPNGLWSSSDLSVASVDVNGIVTGINSGTVMITYTNSSGCPISETITIEALPNAGNSENVIYCIDDSIINLFDELGGIPDTGGTWIGPSILDGGDLGSFDPAVNVAGTYEYTVGNLGTCTPAISTVTVQLSGPPTIDSIDIVDFSNNNTVTVNVTGIGDYVYSIDGINFQTTNIFNNVSPGNHYITIKDLINDCGNVGELIRVYGIPRFFTPNGDGENDTWQIFDVGSLDPTATIYVFDRFGKVISKIDPNSIGWDGTYLGKELPSTDYWYRVSLDRNGEPIERSGNFSLIRRD